MCPLQESNPKKKKKKLFATLKSHVKSFCNVSDSNLLSHFCSLYLWHSDDTSIFFVYANLKYHRTKRIMMHHRNV